MTERFANEVQGVNEVAALEVRLARASDSSAWVDAALALAWALRNQDSGRAHDLAREARGRAIELGLKLAQARAARTLAMTVQDPSAHGEVLAFALEAKALFDEVGDERGRAGARDFLSSMHEYVGDLARALEYALDALAIARELGDPTRIGYALSSVGGILSASGETESARVHLEEALTLFESIEDEDGVAAICARLARLHLDAGSGAVCRLFCERLLKFARARNNEWYEGQALLVLAGLEAGEGHLAEAERIYEALLEGYSNETVRLIQSPEIRVAFARVLMRSQDFARAERMLREAAADAESRSISARYELAAKELLAEILEGRGAFEEAYGLLKRVLELKVQAAQNEGRSKVTQVEARAMMAATKKDAEIHRLRYVELHEMQAKLVESEKMAILGKLAAGTNHELNTPLGVLRSTGQVMESIAQRLLEVAPHSGAPAAVDVKKLVAALEACQSSSRAAIERIAEIAETFRQFAQLDQAERRPYDVSAGIRSALSLLSPNVPKRVSVHTELGSMPLVDAWPRELNHAFLTVLKNAVEAIDGPGSVRVQTACDETGVEVRIEDSGRGLSKTEVDRLFDVTWTHARGRTQMRLGLVAAYASVKKHGGDIDVKSVPGQGTCFCFRFPRPP